MAKRLATIANHVSPSQKPLVVLSHGIGGSSKSLSCLSPIFSDKAVAYDFPGHGNAAAPKEYGPNIAYDTLCQVISSQQQQRPLLLIGYSLGGYVSLRYAVEHPSRVAGLVLISSGPGFRSSDARERWNKAILSSARSSDQVGLHHDSLVMDQMDKASNIPCLVLVGSEDTAFLASAEVFRRRLLRAKVCIIPGAGHRVPETHANELRQHVEEWCKEQGFIPTQ